MNCMDCGNDIDRCTCMHNPLPGKFSPRPEKKATPTTPATVDLLPCPCGAPCDADEGPYSVDFTGTLFRLNCQNADCGWSCISPTREMCRTDWNRRAIVRLGGVDAERPYDLIISDVIGILPLLKGLATFGEFEGIEYDGRPVDYALASAINTLTEFEELDRKYALGQAQGGGT